MKIKRDSGDLTDVTRCRRGAAEAKEILRVRQELNEMMARHTGRTVEQIQKDTDRDYFMSAEEAVTYGLIDRVIEERTQELVTPVPATV